MAYPHIDKIKAIVLDLDGTLYPESSEHLACDAWARRISLYLDKHAPDLSANQGFKRMKRKLSRERRISRLIVEACKISGIPMKPFARYAYNIKTEDAKLSKDIKLSKALSVAGENQELYLFTNSYTNWVENALHSIGISDAFPRRRITDLSDLGFNIKPCKESFRILLKRVRCNKEDMIFLDNSASNVRAAMGFGIRSMQVRSSGGRGTGPLCEILRSYACK